MGHCRYFRYWVVLKGTGWCWGSKKITVGYCIVLLGTTGYSVVLGSTGGHWLVLRVQDGSGGTVCGTRGCTGGHWLVLRVKDGSGGTVWYQRVLWRTIGYWGYWAIQGGTWGVLGSIRGYYGVLGSKMRYCGVLWRIAVYSWVLLGSTGYWGALAGTKGTGDTAGYCWVLPDIETQLPISSPPPSPPYSHTRQYPKYPKYSSITP